VAKQQLRHVGGSIITLAALASRMRKHAKHQSIITAISGR